MTTLVHKSSQPGTKSELDLFYTPATQEQILSGKWIDVHPSGSIDGEVPILFEVKGTDEYIDTSQTFISLKVKFTKNDGSDLDGKQSMGPVMLLLYAIMAQIDITIGNDLITTLTNLDNYKSVFQILTNYSGDTLNTLFQPALYYKDTPGNMDSLFFEPGTSDANVPKYNTGLHKRRELIGSSKEITIIGRLNADFFMQNRYLLDNTDLSIKITRSKSSFCYIGDTDYKLKLLGATLYLRKVVINPEIRLAHAYCLEKGTAKYPFIRVDMKPISVSKGSTEFFKENLCTGAIPSRILFGMIESEAYNGSNKKNPFNFQHFNLSTVQFQLDGNDIPYKPFKLKFKDNNINEAYFSHFLGVNKNISDIGSSIDINDFQKGYAIFAYDLTADLCNDDHFNLIKTGSLRMQLNFEEELTTNIIVIVYLEYQNLIEINKNRQVIFDYNIK